MNAQIRALSLYAIGKSSVEVMEILADEYHSISDEKIQKIAEEMSEQHREKSIPLEN